MVSVSHHVEFFYILALRGASYGTLTVQFPSWRHDDILEGSILGQYLIRMFPQRLGKVIIEAVVYGPNWSAKTGENLFNGIHDPSRSILCTDWILSYSPLGRHGLELSRIHRALCTGYEYSSPLLPSNKLSCTQLDLKDVL
jgi:hypothetical protein